MPSQLSQNLARSYYVIAGGIAAAAGVVAIVSAVVAATTGCVIVFSRADFTNPPTTGPVPANFPSCQQYVDVLSIGIQLAVGAALLVTAWVFSRRGPRVDLIVRGGALLGIVIGAVPGYFIWWLFDYYNQTAGPIELLIGVVPLLVAVAAAWVAWRARANPRLETPSPA
jgi:hypothetical protein